MTDTTRRLIEAGIKAPSGENAQPWSFSVISEEPIRIDIGINSERDKSPYGWGSRASLFAIGAAIENMKIMAHSMGYSTEIKLLDQIEVEKPVATFIAYPGNISHEMELSEAISKRVTNRKKYRDIPIDPKIIEEMHSDLKQQNYSGLSFITENLKIQDAVLAGCTNEAIMLNNKSLHNYFFSHINWTKEQDNKNKIGFYIKTLELPPPAVFGFKLMRSWGRARILNRFFGMNRIVQKQNAVIFGAVPLLGVIYSQTDSRQDAIRAGMTLERLWLTATTKGLSVQPIAGLLYLHLGSAHDSLSGFDKHEVDMINSAYNKIEKSFDLNEKTIFFMFRVGYSDAPTAQAARFSTESVVNR